MKTIYLPLILLLFATSLSAQEVELSPVGVKMDTANVKTIDYSFFLFKAKSNTIGYSIYRNGSPIIQQKIIPSLSGNLGFSNPEHAKLCAQLTIGKLRKNNGLPTLTKEEVTIILSK